MTGRDIPVSLPAHIQQEITQAIQSSQAVLPQPTGAYPTLSNTLVIPQPALSLSTPSANMQQPMATGMYATVAFANQMMPHADYSQNQQRHFDRLKGNQKVPWAVSPQEKKQYSKIFKAWDSENNGYLTGEKAKEIFTQSGLAQNVLMQIWNLSDPNNQGKLNIDEFSVAMHLIYRKLNGYDVPTTLPAELIPPSTRELKDTVDSLKQDLMKGIAQKKSVTSFNDTMVSAASLSVPTSLRSRSVSPGKTAHKTTSKSRHGRDRGKYGNDDDDDDTAYVSSARRMGPDRSRRDDASANASPVSSGASTPKTSYGYRSKTTRIAELRQNIKDQRTRLAQVEEERKNQLPPSLKELPRLQQQDIEDLQQKIRELQEEISRSGTRDSHASLWQQYVEHTNVLASLADDEKTVKEEIRFMLDDVVHSLIKQVDETEDDLKQKKLQQVQKRSALATGQPAPLDDSHIQGTGPNGQVTEADRIRAKAKALIAAKMGKLQQGNGTSSPAVDVKNETRLIEEERAEFKLYLDTVRQSIYQYDDELKEIAMETSLIGLDIRKHQQDQKLIDEHNRFENGHKVAPDLKEFIDRIAFETAVARAPDVDTTFDSRFPELP
ncbi:hypothetical protein DM01DRAFT_1337364 [Hesseltinella vesiculosa]|uniref:Actin cytoskeleton-regulatory complex protein PAN1 n=1 Tax=Hesseltinella vesiculosa TaxID=101127 RepID=A0A1X2GDP6_9FUNG|nr:hypothetical protein DM01DRAFT_1337364 [Hesseltinella vesiculosa]